MGIGVQGEACGEVPQHTGQGLDIHTILKRDSCEGVAKVMESDLGDASSFEDALQHVVHTIRRDGSAVGGWEDIWIFQFFCLGFLLFQNLYRLL